MIILIKPQFEVGKEHVGKNGVVSDPALHKMVCELIENWVDNCPGWAVIGITDSPIKGPQGNKEFLLAAMKDRTGKNLNACPISLAKFMLRRMILWGPLREARYAASAPAPKDPAVGDVRYSSFYHIKLTGGDAREVCAGNADETGPLGEINSVNLARAEQAARPGVRRYSRTIFTSAIPSLVSIVQPVKFGHIRMPHGLAINCPGLP